MKWIKYILIFLISIYIIICGVLFFQQENLLFRPKHLAEDYRFKAGQEVEIPLDNNISMNALWLKGASSKGVILYLHGNKGDAARALHQTRMLQGHGYDIFIPDYRGYGKTEGQYNSDKEIFEDMEKVMTFLTKHYTLDEIAVLGYSLGTGPASYIASKYTFSQLFLIAPFLSITEMKNEIFPLIPSFLIKYKLDNQSHLMQSQVPVTIFHGTNDEVIPFEHGEELAKTVPNAKLITMRDVSHRSAIFEYDIQRVLAQTLGGSNQ